MTHRSESRGFLYTAPPSGDEDVSNEVSGDAAPDERRGMPELESTTAITDANWTGTVPADD